MRMIVPVAAVALGSATIPASAQQAVPPVELSIEQETALRCSAAFAIAAQRQAVGDAAALAWPAVAERGREFFVRTSARIMDETGMTREAVAERISADAAELNEGDALARIMSPCLMLLDASGL